MPREALSSTQSKRSKAKNKAKGRAKPRRVAGELIPANIADEIEYLTDGITNRAQSFVFEYTKDMNGRQAAIRAGYSENGSGQQADVLLKNPNIRRAIELAQAARLQSLSVTADRIVAEYAKIAFLDPKQFYNDDGSLRDITGLPDEVAAAIAGIDIEHRSEGRGDDKVEVTTKKVRLADKLTALKELSKLAVFSGVFKPGGDGDGGGDTTNVQFNYNVTYSGRG